MKKSVLLIALVLFTVFAFSQEKPAPSTTDSTITSHRSDSVNLDQVVTVKMSLGNWQGLFEQIEFLKKSAGRRGFDFDEVMTTKEVITKFEQAMAYQVNGQVVFIKNDSTKSVPPKPAVKKKK